VSIAPSPVASSIGEPLTPTPTASAGLALDLTSVTPTDPALYSQFVQYPDTGIDFRTQQKHRMRNLQVLVRHRILLGLRCQRVRLRASSTRGREGFVFN
jgi:hypothetical protein